MRFFRHRCLQQDDRPSIVFVQDALYESGGTRFAHRVVRAMRSDGVNAGMAILTQPADDIRRFAADAGVPVRYASPERKRFRQALPEVVIGYAKIIRSADIVVSASEVGYGMILGVGLSRLFRTPFVSLVQSPLPQSTAAWRPACLRPLVRWANRHVDLAACVSPGVHASVLANGLPPDRAIALRVGADTEAVLRAGTPCIRRPDHAPPRLIAMGRLEPVKGFDLLIRASALLKDRGLAHELIIIGEGREHQALQHLIDSLGVSGQVTLAGFIENPQAILAGADAFVLSSRFEGSGGTVLFEALTHGVPVIATDCTTGPRTVLDDGRFGDLVPVENPDALAGAIQSFLIDPGPLQAKAALGPSRAAAFDQGEAGRALLDIIRLRFTVTKTAPGRSRYHSHVGGSMSIPKGLWS